VAFGSRKVKLGIPLLRINIKAKLNTIAARHVRDTIKIFIFVSNLSLSSLALFLPILQNIRFCLIYKCCKE